SPCGRRWREAPDEGSLSAATDPSSAFASLRHLLPQGEKEAKISKTTPCTVANGRRPAWSARLAKGQIDPLPAQKRMLAVGQRRDAMEEQPGRPAPHRDVAVLQ